MSEYKATTIKAITADDASQKTTVFLDGTSGVVRAGSYGRDGELQLMPSDLVDGKVIGPSDDLTGAHATIHMKASNAHVRIGGGAVAPGTIGVENGGQDGRLALQNAWRRNMIVLDAEKSDVWVGGGDSTLAPFHFDSTDGHLRIGGGSAGNGAPVLTGREGRITLQDKGRQERLRLDAADGLAIKRLHGDDPETVVRLDDSGSLTLKHREKGLHTTIGLEADGGKVQIYDNAGKRQIYLHGETGNVELYKGRLKLDEGGIVLEKGDVVVKGGGNIHVRDSGDITVGGSDCAEEFDCVEAVAIEAGSVVVIDQGGALRPSSQAYDRRVAGVVSGAGAFKPGLVLGRDQAGCNRKPVALVGKVYCRVDACEAAIEVGDLLTTSSTPGHAMKASDPMRAFGAVIGKAMRPLAGGQGLIPILIALQ